MRDKKANCQGNYLGNLLFCRFIPHAFILGATPKDIALEYIFLKCAKYNRNNNIIY